MARNEHILIGLGIALGAAAMAAAAPVLGWVELKEHTAGLIGGVAGGVIAVVGAFIVARMQIEHERQRHEKDKRDDTSESIQRYLLRANIISQAAQIMIDFGNSAGAEWGDKQRLAFDDFDQYWHAMEWIDDAPSDLPHRLWQDWATFRNEVQRTYRTMNRNIGMGGAEVVRIAMADLNALQIASLRFVLCLTRFAADETSFSIDEPVGAHATNRHS